MSTSTPFRGLDLLATAVVLLGQKLQVRYVNPAAEALFAIGRKSATDHPFPSLFSDPGPLAGLLDQAIYARSGGSPSKT